MFWTTKVIESFTSPAALALAGGVVILMLLALGLRRLTMGVLLLGLVLLWLASAPVMARALAGWLEHQNPMVSVADSPSADAIVILGGGVVEPAPLENADPHLGGSGDRLLHAFELFRAKKAKVILASGGWARPGGPPAEADLMRMVLEQLGVPASAILIEDRSRTTEENGAYSAAIMHRNGLSTALLVTSAIHMPRALATFRRSGVEVIPSPADFIDTPSQNPPWLDWLPDTYALWHFNAAVHEIVGYLYYRLRGWT